MKSEKILSIALAFAALAVRPAAAQTDLNSTFEAARAAVKAQPKQMFPQLMSCEAADWSKAAVSAPVRTEGKVDLGWIRGGTSLVLLTKTAAYYYHEDCDICAEVTKCELATGRLSSAVVAHSVDCADMKPYSKDVVYDSCADGGR
jgi:acyl-coenzyme A thioesterase PaaI-like protein